MEVSEGRETSEDGRGKGGKTIGMKIWRKRGMKKREMKEEMRGNEESSERGQTIKHIRWKGGERVIIKTD